MAPTSPGHSLNHSLSGTWAPSFFTSLVRASSCDADDSGFRGSFRSRSQPDVASAESRTAPARLIGGIPISELITRIRAGEQDALATLYLGVFDELWHIALLQTGSPDTASEIIQDVFLRLWLRRATLPAETSDVYLAAAVRNQARNVRRHAHVVDTVVGAAEIGRELGKDLPAMGQATASADAQLEDQEFRDAYYAAIRALSDQERLAVFLRWEEERSFEDIGQILSMSKVGARKVILRAQKKVQALLSKYRG